MTNDSAQLRTATAKPDSGLSLRTRASLIEEIRRLRRASAAGDRQAETELQIVQAELESALEEMDRCRAEADASRERYTALFEYAPVAYAVLDSFGVIKALNIQAAALLGEDRRPLLGKPLLVYAVQADRRAFLDHMHRCRRTPGEVASELSLKNRRGALVPVRLLSRGLLPVDEDQLYHTAIIDLTERKEAEERLRVAERLASLGTLSAGLAHEINNPLNSILLSAQVGLTMVRSSPRDPQIVEEARRGGRLVRNMLAFAKQETTQKWPVDLNAIVRRVVTLTEALPGGVCYTHLRLAPHLPQVTVNPTEIEQVLMNLIRNAAEATRNGECRVLIKTEQRGWGVRLTVADNGVGIPPERLPRIFDPFYTTKRGSGGSGLGLSIVYAIITGHQGSIKAESQPEGGTRFVIELPVHADGEVHDKNASRK
jgi:two-component system, sporulation sensor kinase E